MLLRFLGSLLVSCAVGVELRDQTVQGRSSLLAQTWGGLLDGTASRQMASDTPVTRAVNLLKEMQATLEKDMEEDENQYDKLACWCNTNKDEKKTAIKTNTDKVAELESTIEELTASSASLKEKIKELNEEVAENKDALAKATAIRKKELAAFATEEQDGVANIASLKAAITVLSKHHDAALPQLAAVPLSFLQSQSKKDDPWGLESKADRDLDMFMAGNAFGADGVDDKIENHFLQAAPTTPKVRSFKAQLEDEWTYGDVSTVQMALRSAHSFAQRRGRDDSAYVPAYNAQSGEIFGMLKQMREDMEKDLKDAQELEHKRATDFAELRSAKTAEIEGGEKSSEQKEDELAKTDNDLAEAKEDLIQTKDTLAQDKKFLKGLLRTCKEADANFALRKKSRLQEMEAVADTIEILTEDDARDAMSGTFKKEKSFLQVSSKRQSDRRKLAARFLRRKAAESGSPELAMLSSSVELDAFKKVKAKIDKMTEMLETQQADEVKKHDFCKEELHSNEMATMKAKDTQKDLEASVEERKVAVQTFEEEIAATKNAIKKEQVSLQQATINRKKENLDFQKTIADQTLTIEVLEKAMNRLAEFYDESFVQIHGKEDPVPPVPQVKYEKSKGGGGVMSLIEKLIYDAKEIMQESRKAESEAQADYEEMVADTNGTVKALGKQVLSKTDAKVEAEKDLAQKEMDLSATDKELERLTKTDQDLHNECDYLMKNFMLRQDARQQEMDSLRQAKMILSGAASNP